MNGRMRIPAGLLLLSASGCMWEVTGPCTKCVEGTPRVESITGVGCGYISALADARNSCVGGTFIPADDGPNGQLCIQAQLSAAEWQNTLASTAQELWWMNARAQFPRSADADSCPMGDVQVTIKIVNQFFGCFDGGPTYFRCTYSTTIGESATTKAVGAGETTTLSISAHDGNQDGAADVLRIDYSGAGDLDPNYCSSGSLSFDDSLRNGDTWTLTLNADGTLTDTVARGRTANAKAASSEPLKPIPDPRFTPSSK